MRHASFFVNSENGGVALSVFIDHSAGWDGFNPLLWGQLEEEGNQEWGEADTNASSKATAVEWCSSNDAREIVGHYNLPSKSKSNYEKEEIVMSELLENIEVTSSNLSAVYLVEDLQEHKGVENIGQMEKFVLTFLIGLHFDFIIFRGG